MDELGKLQGYTETMVAKLVSSGASASDIGRAFGNGQSLNVLERLLAHLLFCAGITDKEIDVWKIAADKARKLSSRPSNFVNFLATVRNAEQ